MTKVLKTGSPSGFYIFGSGLWRTCRITRRCHRRGTLQMRLCLILQKNSS